VANETQVIPEALESVADRVRAYGQVLEHRGPQVVSAYNALGASVATSVERFFVLAVRAQNLAADKFTESMRFSQQADAHVAAIRALPPDDPGIQEHRDLMQRARAKQSAAATEASAAAQLADQIRATIEQYQALHHLHGVFDGALDRLGTHGPWVRESGDTVATFASAVARIDETSERDVVSVSDAELRALAQPRRNYQFTHIPIDLDASFHFSVPEGAEDDGMRALVAEQRIEATERFLRTVALQASAGQVPSAENPNLTRAAGPVPFDGTLLSVPSPAVSSTVAGALPVTEPTPQFGIPVAANPPASTTSSTSSSSSSTSDSAMRLDLLPDMRPGESFMEAWQRQQRGLPLTVGPSGILFGDSLAQAPMGPPAPSTTTTTVAK